MTTLEPILGLIATMAVIVLATCVFLIITVSRLEEEARNIAEASNLIIQKLNKKQYKSKSDNPYQE